VDRAALVETLIGDGRDLIEQLVRNGENVTAAGWIKTSDDGTRFLYLALPGIEKEGSRNAQEASKNNSAGRMCHPSSCRTDGQSVLRSNCWTPPWDPSRNNFGERGGAAPRWAEQGADAPRSPWTLFLEAPLPAYRGRDEANAGAFLVDELEVKVIDATDPLAVAGADYRRRHGAKRVLPYREDHRGGVSIEGACVYPPVTAAPQPE
jgi:hypothetical protein